jgi:signal transduction histidine kinase
VNPHFADTGLRTFRTQDFLPLVLTGLLLGFALGVLLTLAASWRFAKRYISRIRAAERRARAAERMAEIGAMTGGLAHEIKNPLSTIGLNVQLLIEAIEDLEIPDAERTRLLNRMRGLGREVERLRGILTDFLEFAGKVHADPRPTNLNVLVDELIDFYRPEAERHGVRVRSEFDPEPLTANIDPKLIKQAVLNLMLNATQAMAAASSFQNTAPVGGYYATTADSARGIGSGGSGGSGGAAGGGESARINELILRTSRRKDPDGSMIAVIDVIDTGPGMAAETLAKIFQPYFTTKSGGSGLGLPAARRLIEEHAGRLDVHSEVGQGTSFSVIFPLHEPAA